ncbi:MAG: cytochrome b/b6 domain-containing protein [Sphingomicrobium sp.]
MPRQISVGDAPLTGSPPKQAVWDLPIRLFHWVLAGLIAFSWWSIEYHHGDWHIWSGIAILTLLLFRLLWGVVGSSTARFSSFIRGPTAIRRYLGGDWRGIGHSPLGALSVVALLGATAVQVGLGLVAEDEDGVMTGPLSRLVSIDTSDAARNLHEIWFYVLLAFIALHVAAILFFRWRGKKLIAPMITGKTAEEPGTAPMRPAKWWLAIVCLVIAIGISRWVLAGAPPFSP